MWKNHHQKVDYFVSTDLFTYTQLLLLESTIDPDTDEKFVISTPLIPSPPPPHQPVCEWGRAATPEVAGNANNNTRWIKHSRFGNSSVLPCRTSTSYGRAKQLNATKAS